VKEVRPIRQENSSSSLFCVQQRRRFPTTYLPFHSGYCERDGFFEGTTTDSLYGTSDLSAEQGGVIG